MPPKGNVAIIRLTTKCNFRCGHCCFECGPKRKDRMTPEIAGQTANLLKSNVAWLNVMGGEITLIPHYEELLSTVQVAPMRIVTNGWWVKNQVARDKFVSVVRQLNKAGQIHIGISRDRQHPAGVGDAAFSWLSSQITFDDDWGFTQTKDIDEENKSIAPVGRAYLNELGDDMLRMFSAYCQAHEHNKSLTILENGTVTYCPFGAWPIGQVTDTYEALMKRRDHCAKQWIPNCVTCWRQWEGSKKNPKNKPITECIENS
jgi:hypothetical protein